MQSGTNETSTNMSYSAVKKERIFAMSRGFLTGALGSLGAVCLLGLFTSSTLPATPLTWTVSGTFDNGSALAGTFEYDADTSTVSNWDLTGAFNYEFTPSNSLHQLGQCCTDQTDFIFYTPDGLLTLDFAFNPDLTDAGITSNIAGGEETYQFTDKPATTYLLVSGSGYTGSAPVIPEPASLCYLAIGLPLGAFVLIRRHRRC
jgi:hypothetical protein